MSQVLAFYSTLLTFLENGFTNLTTITIIQEVICQSGFKKIIRKWAEMKQLF
jgi:hypothetical protein